MFAGLNCIEHIFQGVYFIFTVLGVDGLPDNPPRERENDRLLRRVKMGSIFQENDIPHCILFHNLDIQTQGSTI